MVVKPKLKKKYRNPFTWVTRQNVSETARTSPKREYAYCKCGQEFDKIIDGVFHVIYFPLSVPKEEWYKHHEVHSWTEMSGNEQYRWRRKHKKLNERLRSAKHSGQNSE